MAQTTGITDAHLRIVGDALVAEFAAAGAAIIEADAARRVLGIPADVPYIDEADHEHEWVTTSISELFRHKACNHCHVRLVVPRA